MMFINIIEHRLHWNMKFLHFSFKNIKFIMMIRDWNFQSFDIDFSSKTFHSSIFLSISYDKFMRRMRYGDDDDACWWSMGKRSHERFHHKVQHSSENCLKKMIFDEKVALRSWKWFQPKTKTMGNCKMLEDSQKRSLDQTTFQLLRNCEPFTLRWHL